MKSKMSRRGFLGTFVTGSATLAAAIFAVACDGGDKGTSQAPKPAAPKPAAPKPSAPKPATGCTDVSALSDAEKSLRTAMKYEDKTSDPAKRCDSCQLYVAAAGGAACGGCTVVKGPIAPAGSCASWVAKA